MIFKCLCLLLQAWPRMTLASDPNHCSEFITFSHPRGSAHKGDSSIFNYGASVARDFLDPCLPQPDLHSFHHLCEGCRERGFCRRNLKRKNPPLSHRKWGNFWGKNEEKKMRRKFSEVAYRNEKTLKGKMAHRGVIT